MLFFKGMWAFGFAVSLPRQTVLHSEVAVDADAADFPLPIENILFL
jgi:hypothetical protein